MTVLPGGRKFTKPGERNPAEGKSKIFLPWNEAPLNFVSLRSSLHYVGLVRLSRVKMNAQKTGALDSLTNPKGRSVSNFSLDTADDFIDGPKERRKLWFPGLRVSPRS